MFMYTHKDDSNYRKPLEGVRFKTLVYGEKTLLAEFHLDKGSTIPAHQHPHEQTGYLVSGRLDFTVGEEKFIAEPGTSWSLPGNIEHSVEVLEDAVVVEVFSPIREEYLP